MISLNLRRNYISDKWGFKESDILEQISLKAVINNGVIFNHLFRDNV